ncbi:hypothetical protein [Streptomyces doebereineriae]|uniref:Uncharacterized protein n=1 Tax=Streptomyces doebereineriae TaxID=3075528 RepID=A0ABU2V1Q3_9ACTN|nr:hypothetical protein [Streptomyces sp. DSM 41640]MDT0479482.1 hypothetical protein [Streptomyces sp. DSM 41640]
MLKTQAGGHPLRRDLHEGGLRQHRPGLAFVATQAKLKTTPAFDAVGVMNYTE